MRTLFRGTSALVVLMLVASCSSLLKKKGTDADAGEDAAAVVADLDAAPTPAPATEPVVAALATNEGDVARFPDEEKLPDLTATLLRTYNVREAPPAGTLIVGLGKGASVTQIAKRSTFFLITFDNPKAAGTKLMGWVHRDAFSAVVQDAGPLVCPVGEIALFSDTPFCGKLCSADTDCPKGQACKGQANKLLSSGKAGDGVTVCTVFHPHDAGAPPGPLPTPIIVIDAGSKGLANLVDAGKPVVPDAGPAPTPPTPPAPPAPAADVVAPTGLAMACPTGFVLVNKTKKCHRLCPGGITAGQCKNANPFCIKCDNDTKKVCADNREQCK